jgi:hypothetical protein
MSMKNTGASGYLIKASDITKHLSADLQTEYNKLIDTENSIGLEDFLADNMPAGFPQFESVFVAIEEHEAEDLEIGTMYIILNEDDLFIKNESPQMKTLKAAGITPDLQHWVVWG